MLKTVIGLFRAQMLRQEKQDQELNEMISKVREGKVQAGPAFKRLFGIEGSANAGQPNGESKK